MSKLTNEIYFSLTQARSKLDILKLVDLPLDTPTEEIAALIKVHQLLTQAMALVAEKPDNTTFDVSVPRYNSYTGVNSFQIVSLPVPASDLMLLANNNKVRAIKMYRERYAVGLSEAKYAIEQALDKQRLEGKL